LQVPVCVFDLVVVAVVDRSFFVAFGDGGVRADCIDLMVAVHHRLYRRYLYLHGNLTTVLLPDIAVVVVAAAHIAAHAPNYYYHRQTYFEGPLDHNYC